MGLMQCTPVSEKSMCVESSGINQRWKTVLLHGCMHKPIHSGKSAMAHATSCMPSSFSFLEAMIVFAVQQSIYTSLGSSIALDNLGRDRPRPFQTKLPRKGQSCSSFRLFSCKVSLCDTTVIFLSNNCSHDDYKLHSLPHTCSRFYHNQCSIPSGLSKSILSMRMPNRFAQTRRPLSRFLKHMPSDSLQSSIEWLCLLWRQHNTTAPGSRSVDGRRNHERSSQNPQPGRRSCTSCANTYARSGSNFA